MRPFNIKSSIFKNKLRNPVSIFIVLFIIIWLLIPIFTLRPFAGTSTAFFDDWFSGIESEALTYFLTIDQPILHEIIDEEERTSLSQMIVPLFTRLPYQDIRLLFGHELPKSPMQQSTIAIRGSGTNQFTTSMESAPPEGLFDDEIIEEEQPPQRTYADEAVLIYTSHNRESFRPEIEPGRTPNESFHQTENVMKLSKNLQERLDAFGIDTYVDQTDIYQQLILEEMTYYESYDYAREVVKQALDQNEDLKFMIDIHRDAQPREITTTEINGKSAAKVMFVVGGEHDSYEENLAFAADLHQRLEDKYPTISRGVEVKAGTGSNGVYNQDLTPNSILLEVGGYDNTYEELFYTLELFAEIFAEYYFDQLEGVEEVEAND